MFQVLSPNRRVELPPDGELFAHEIDREFPEVRRVVDDLYAELARTNAAADAAFERDLVWPPGTFWERRETLRVAGALPLLRGPSREFLAEFPRDHDYRTIVLTPARFASDLAGEPPPFAVARLHGAWTRGVLRLERGEPGLVEFLLERVRAHGGETRIDEKAASLVVRHGRVSGVRIDGEEAATGAQFVVTDLPAREFLDLAPEAQLSVRALGRWPHVEAREGRFVVSMVVRDEGLPSPLAVETFLLPPPRTGLPVHLQQQRGVSAGAGTTVLVAEAIVGEGVPIGIRHAREAVLATVEHHLPFVERHYLLVDSPHDGRPLWDLRSGTRVEVDRAHLRATGGSLDAEPMRPRWHVESPDLHGLAGEPVRLPLPGCFGVGSAALPALGQEGELLAAWSAARLITRTDQRKERMRRELWSKMELG